MKLLDKTDPVYLQMVKDFEKTRKVNKELGAADPDTDLAELVRIEVGQIIGNHVEAGKLAQLAYEWRTKKNPFTADLLMIACYEQEISPPPSVVTVLNEAAQARFYDETRGGTSKQLRKEQRKNFCLNLMANLIFIGDSMETAASKTAQLHYSHYGEILKGSTLQIEYRKRMRKPQSDYRNSGEKISTEQRLFRIWREAGDSYPREYWKKISETLPEADCSLHGNVRG